MAGLKNLMRDYERARYPADQRLDLQGEGVRVARERALHWIQSRAHETPGADLLLIAERVVRPGRPPGPIAVVLEKLLRELDGRLIEWWQPFTPGTFALRLSRDPRMWREGENPPPDPGTGRTEETAGAARPSPVDDIPAELLDDARLAANLRIEREDLSIRLEEVVLREIWIEAQALAMESRMTFAEAIRRLIRDEEEARFTDL